MFLHALCQLDIVGLVARFLTLTEILSNRSEVVDGLKWIFCCCYMLDKIGFSTLSVFDVLLVDECYFCCCFHFVCCCCWYWTLFKVNSLDALRLKKNSPIFFVVCVLLLGGYFFSQIFFVSFCRPSFCFFFL